MLKYISSVPVPFIILVLCICFARDKRSILYDSFIKGAREGMETVIKILPTMTLLLTALCIFRASGAADILTRVLSPILSKIGIPAGIIPLIVTRPISGSASMAAYSDIISTYGADSLESFAASVVMGSGDTLVYVISVYFSATRVKKTGCVIPVSVFVAVLGAIISCILAGIFFTS